MFKIEQKQNSYVVIPTADYLLQNFNRFEMPYDSNWEIYKLYNFLPKELFQYLIAVFNATIYIYPEYPYATISFKKQEDAQRFLEDLILRANNTIEKKY